VATAINTGGLITGIVGPFPDAEGEELDMSTPFIFDGSFTLHATREPSSESKAINKDGTIVGSDIDERDEFSDERAWVIPAGGAFAYLPVLAPGSGTAAGINDFGTIVGSGPVNATEHHALLWRKQ
jgi:hypothetical protein